MGTSPQQRQIAQKTDITPAAGLQGWRVGNPEKSLAFFNGVQFQHAKVID
jgi:hypothetical protein